MEPAGSDAAVGTLARRVGLVDAVVFSRGEPCADPALQEAMGQVRALGFEVGLHTSGAYPRRLAEVLPLVDWVGMDVKTSFQDYHGITCIVDSGRHARASAQPILTSRVVHEFRTTVHPELHSEHEIVALAQTLSDIGVRRYVLQVFRDVGCADAGLNATSTAGYPSDDLATQISTLFSSFSVRRSAPNTD